MACLMKPNSEYSKANEYINKARTIILQQYNIINVQLLHALALISIYGILIYNNNTCSISKIILINNNNTCSKSKNNII
ncbi:hypothetical protein PIROE2DRAFT_13795 [Piromyces sp. E2]|nr:hypothetical protein PIROE2DRAFT_13795 [Piromyces sp. E2]|eukprot:OUM60446.1 hypothetical protein PIROE2DRAFT_13795 [Piromyces sp. E2]